MPIAVTISKVEASGQNLYAQGYLTFSGNYSTGGDTLDFTQATADPSFQGLNPQIESTGPCDGLAAWSVNGNLLFQYVPIQGNALNNNKIKVSASGTFGTELAAGAYPAGVTGDKVAWTAAFKKMI